MEAVAHEVVAQGHQRRRSKWTRRREVVGVHMTHNQQQDSIKRHQRDEIVQAGHHRLMIMLHKGGISSLVSPRMFSFTASRCTMEKMAV